MITPARILITGGAGQTATRMTRLLSAGNTPVRCLVTRESSARQVRDLGGQPYIGDLRDAGSVLAAMQGIEKVYHIAPTLSQDEHGMGRRVLAAAQAAGVKHFVLHGVMAPYLQNINYHWAKEKIQWDLYRSGLAFTVLLPTNFMQNIGWTWQSILRDGVWELPYDVDRKITWVDLDDVAEAAVRVLTEPGHELATYELCGNDALLSRREIAALMTRELGRPVEAVKIGIDDYLARYRQNPFFARTTQEELEQIREMFMDYDRYGMPAGNGRVLSMLLGRPAGDYRAFLGKLDKASLHTGSDVVTNYGLPVATA